MPNPTIGPLYPASGDGQVRGGSNTSWATARALTTGYDAYAAQSGEANLCYEGNNAGDAYTYFIARGFLPNFDTSSLPDGCTILSATLYVWVVNKYDNDSGAAVLVSNSQASSTTLSTSDFDNVGSTALSNELTFSGVTTGAYNGFVLNDAGLESINKSGYTSFAVRGTKDLNNVSPGNTKYNCLTTYYSERAGTSNDPYLVVEYSTNGEVVVWDEGFNTALNGAHNPIGSTITVTTTTGAPSSGTLWVIDNTNSLQHQAVGTYTGKTGTTFTGCSWTSKIGKTTYADGSLDFPSGASVSVPTAETHFPQITSLDAPGTSNPTLMISAQQHGGHSALDGKLIYKKSTTNGKTWGTEGNIRSSPANGSTYGIFGHTMSRLKNGRLLCLWYEHKMDYTVGDSIMDMRQMLSYSDDAGATWSTPVTVPLNMGYSDHDGSCGFSSMLYTGAGSNSTYGDLYVPITGNKDGIQIHASGEPYRWETWLYKITDGGASGTMTKVAEVFKYSDVGHAAGEGAIEIAANGDWIMHARIEANTSESAAYDRDRWQSRSTDAGATWSTPVEVIASFANGAVLTKLPDDTLISTGSAVGASDLYVGATASVYSRDNGTTWTRNLKWEAQDATYEIYNGADLQVIINDPDIEPNTVLTYAQERQNQAGARTMFRWYANPLRDTSDAWAWSDSAVGRISAAFKAASDSWAWGDSGSVPVNAQRTTGDNLAWSDSATWAPVYLARTSSDAWAWADALARALVLGATAADAWIWTDSATRVGGALYYSRTTVDTWSWTDAIGASAATFYWFRTRRSDMSTPTKTYVQVLPKGTTRTSTYTSPTYRAETEAGILVVLDVTAASGTGGLTLRINAHDQASAQAIPLNAAPTAVTATGTTSYALYPFGAIAGNVTQATSFYLPRMFSITVTHEDSSSYTYSLGYCLLP